MVRSLIINILLFAFVTLSFLANKAFATPAKQFIKVEAIDLSCEVEGNIFSISIETYYQGAHTGLNFLNYRINNKREVERRANLCMASIAQAQKEGASIYINVKTGEMRPEDGFYFRKKMNISAVNK